MHIHLYGIAYDKREKIKHLMLPDSDFRYAELLEAPKKRNAKGVIISDNVPYLEQDVIFLQQTHRALS